jgi:ATP-dependent protease ClpP protease subunit
MEKEKNSAKERQEQIREIGQITLPGPGNSSIHLLSIIGEIEGHENLPAGSKTTKYEHVLPELAYVEECKQIKGLLLLENSMGGDCSAGLAIAEMIASLSKPTVSLVIGDSHSIGVPLAVAADYSFIVPSGTMVIHPVRMSGTVIGTPQTYDYIKIIQDRIVRFISGHSKVSRERLEEMMMETGMLTKDVGTILVGEEAVKEGIICEIGGISQALKKLNELIEEREG